MQSNRKKVGDHYLESKGAYDGFMVADTVLHVADVSVLH